MNTQQGSSTKRVDVICSSQDQIALEALLDAAVFRFPHTSVSLETQQMDEAKRVSDLADHHENIRKLLKAEKPTGVPHLFVLDAEKLAGGDMQSQSVLQALASQQFNRNTAAVALLPPSIDRSPETELTAQTLKDGILAEVGITTLESIDAINSHFNIPTVSMEKIGFLRRLFESSDKATNGTITHQQIRQELIQRGGEFTPWSEEEVKYVEQSLKVSFHHEIHRLLTTLGTIHLRGLRTFSPLQTIENTQEFRGNLRAVGKTKDWVILSAQNYADEPEVTYFVILDASNGKASAFSSAGGYLRQPNVSFSNMLMLAVKTT